MKTMPGERFVSESIKPSIDSMDAVEAAAGEPSFPRRFRWRDEDYEVLRLIESWRESGACRSGSRERYTRKHWFRVETTSGHEMKIYFERQAKTPQQRCQRWWLFSVRNPETPNL